MQAFKDTSCSWELDLGQQGGRKSSNRTILYLDFNDFYTSVTGNRGVCNDFSSGHNFYTPLLNGPETHAFTVLVFNATYVTCRDRPTSLFLLFPFTSLLSLSFSLRSA